MSNTGTKKLFVETHGCQMNEYDSARMTDLLGASHGLEQTDSADEADVLLLCTGAGFSAAGLGRARPFMSQPSVQST